VTWVFESFPHYLIRLDSGLLTSEGNPLRGGTGIHTRLITLLQSQTRAPAIYRKAKTMAEVDFTDIIIIGNHTAKPPRKEGRNKDGRDQFMITFSLSRNAKGPWIEAFNQVWRKQSKQTASLQLPIVSDDQIQITCPLDEQLQGYLDDLKRDVATTNQMYRDQLQATENEKRSHNELLQQLRF
jgi:hypothetical protein